MTAVPVTAPAPPATRRIIVGVIGPGPIETALRYALGEAGRRRAAVRVIVTGPVPTGGETFLADAVHRWAEKYPAVDVDLTVRRTVDAVITLAAASRDADLLVVAAAPGARNAATVAALTHRAHSPVLVADALTGRSTG